MTLRPVDMNLAVLSVILSLNTHDSLVSHLATMLNTSGFVIGLPLNHDAQLGSELIGGRIPESLDIFPLWSWRKIGNTAITKHRNSGV